MVGTSRTNRADREGGFTLVELLIVIVILGVLATVTVFAVRGVTDDGQSAACDSEFSNLQRAQEMHLVQHGAFADEAGLVANGAIVEESTLYNVALNGDGYDLTPVDANCTQSATAVGAGAAAPPVIPAADPPNTRAELRTTNFAGLGSTDQWGLRSGDPNGHAEILVFGRGAGAADFAAMVADNVPANRRVTFLDIGGVHTVDRLDDALSQAGNTPPTSYVIYPGDDTSAFGAPPDQFVDFRTALEARIATNANWAGSITELDGTSATLTDHLLSLL